MIFPMALDPQCKAVLDGMAAAGGPPLEALTPAEARARRAAAAEAMAALSGPVVEMWKVQDRICPGPAGDIPVRVYWPKNEEGLPILLYFHGGGWVLGDLNSWDRTCRHVAAAGQCVLISVDYRLAPEHKFPAAVEDAYAALEWASETADSLGGDAKRIAVGGDSAGGNLATVICMMARDHKGPKVAFQLLIYPVTDHADDRQSMAEFGEGHFLTRAGMQWFWGHYLRVASDGESPLASPILGELAGLPPALVITAECDPIRDQGEAYAARLQAAGVEASVLRYEGAIHVFFNLPGAIDAANQAIADAGAALRKAFA
jgi:acetyl esterase